MEPFTPTTDEVLQALAFCRGYGLGGFPTCPDNEKPEEAINRWLATQPKLTPDTPEVKLPNRAAIAQEIYVTHRHDIPDNTRAIDLAETATDRVLNLIENKNQPKT